MSFTAAAVLATLALAAPAAAAPVPLDLSTHLDADVVVNHDGNAFDTGNVGIDQNQFGFASDTAMGAAGCSAGLPDDGAFAPANRPAVVLANLANGNTGNNGVQFVQAHKSVVVDVADGRYGALHVYAASGNGPVLLYLRYAYTDGTVSEDGGASVLVPDWFSGPGSGANYSLASGLGRMTTTDGNHQCQDAPDGLTGSIWGLVAAPDPAKVLDTITFRADPGVDFEADSRTTLFGGLLIPARDVTVTKTGSGAGTVTSQPAGIACGDDCTGSYPEDGSVSLTAVAATGSRFAGWGGACLGTGATCIIATDEAKTVTATFELRPQQQQQPPPPPQSGNPPPPSDQPPAPINQPAPPAPAPLPPVTRPVAFSKLASASRRCARRQVRLRLRGDTAEDVRRLVVRAGSRKVTLGGVVLDGVMVVRNVPRGAFRLRLEAQLNGGDTLLTSRRFGRCGPRRG
jgi:hypothetical protein